MEVSLDQSRERLGRKAQADMPQWVKLVDEVEAVAADMFRLRVLIGNNNSADVMALSFAIKQREHLRSVRVLIDAGLHRDALLIARAMLEGLVRLRWAFNDSPSRTDLWFWYEAIADWLQTRKNEAKGISSDPRDKAELTAYVAKHGRSYLKRDKGTTLAATEKAGSLYELSDDSWKTKWTDANVKEMFADVKLERLYEGIYDEASDWIHWGPQSILRAIELAEWGIAGFKQEDWPSAVRALVIGCYSLVASLQIMDGQLSLGRVGRLTTLSEKITAIIEESLEPDSQSKSSRNLA